ncbi:MAG: TonB-dependent receptor [Hydrotalea sp.]|nr:TonB-dependent receptor [Hydrotalea sp.]
MKKIPTIAKLIKSCHQVAVNKILLTVLFLFGVSQGFGRLTAQSITIKANEMEIVQVLSAIEKQGEVRFLYNSRMKELRQRVSINKVNATVDDVLKQVFAGTSLTYTQLDNKLIAIRSAAPLVQDIRVTGRVLSETGEPVVGASVMVRGSQAGVVTDARGAFSILAPDDATLVVSAIGFNDVQIAVNKQTILSIQMTSVAKVIDDVVVIGFGTAKKRDLTGSISSIKGSELEKMPNTNPITSLQGKVPGLTIAASGRAGSAPVVRIRGINSTNSASPVFVVDGVLHDNIDFLNPADIESIDVLRDPSSIAIYGLRGANGVIAVTTKRPVRGQMRINFQSTFGIQTVQDKIDVVDAAGFRRLYTAQLNNLNAAPFDFTNYTANTNWQNEVFRTAVINTNNLSISSSTDKGSTLLNVGYTNQDGVLKYDNHERFLLRFNQEMKLSKNIKIGGDLNGSYFRDNPPAASVSNALWAAPIVPIKQDDQTYYAMPSFQRAQVGNPVANMERGNRTSINDGYRVIGSLFAEVTFLRDFTWRSVIYADLAFNSSRGFTPLPFTFINLGEGAAPTTTFFDNLARTSVNQSQSQSRRFQQDHTLTYNAKLKNGHGLTAMAGMTTLYRSSSFVNGSRRDTLINIPNDPNFWYLNIANVNNPLLNGGGGSENAIAGFFSRVSYNYKGKYLLNATIRRDGSSSFAPANRWGTFGSVGLGWVVSDEEWFSNQKTIDFFKVRGAWGTTGNANGFSDFLWRPGLSNASSAIFGDNVYTAVQASYIPDSTLRWETVNGLDIGFDLKAMNNRLSFGFTYYNRTTKGILTAVTIPNETRSFFTNLGEITNKGVEFTLGWDDRIGKHFTYGIDANFSYNRNVVNSIGSNLDFQILGNGGVNRTITGFSIGHFFGFRQTGVYQTTAQLARVPAFSNSLPGDIAFADINGDGVITQADREYLGTPFPPYSFGININMAYKGFDFNIEGQGMAGNKIFTQRRTANFATLNYEANRLNAWTGPGTSNIEPILDNTRGNNFLFSTYFLEPGDFFRIRTIQIGYTFDKINSLGIKKARVFVSGQNVFTWTKATGYTPEPQIGSILGGGADNGVYPVPSIYTMGINVTF